MSFQEALESMLLERHQRDNLRRRETAVQEMALTFILQALRSGNAFITSDVDRDALVRQCFALADRFAQEVDTRLEKLRTEEADGVAQGDFPAGGTNGGGVG